MCEWTKFYEGRLLDENYLRYVQLRYRPFLSEICDSMKPGDRVIEVGCGMATITSILTGTSIFCGYRAYDLSPDMVHYAQINLGGYPVEVGDARLPTGKLPDIVHSHGLLEHMSDDDIRSVIDASRKDGARAAIHYVPGDKYERPSFGDERLMSLKQWVDICAPTDFFDFNDGYDYVLKWIF